MINNLQTGEDRFVIYNVKLCLRLAFMYFASSVVISRVTTN